MAGEVTDPGVEVEGTGIEGVSAIILLNRHVVRLPSKCLIYIHRFKLLSTLVREVPFYSRHQLMQKLLTVQSAENK